MGTTITDSFGDLLHWSFRTCSFQATGWGVEGGACQRRGRMPSAVGGPLSEEPAELL